MTPFPYLIAMILFGILGTYSDIKKNRIRNWIIITMFFVKISIDIILIVTKNSSFSEISSTYINMLAALILSVILWTIGFWGPGDAKFFTAIVGFVPVAFYPTNKIVLFNILPFIMVPAIVILLGITLIKSSAKQKKEAISEIIRPNALISNVLAVFWISWIVIILENIFNIKPDPMINFFAFIAISQVMNRFASDKKIYVYAGLSIARIMFDLKRISTVDFWINFTLSAAIFIILLGILTYLGKEYFRPKKKNIKDISSGVAVSENFRIIKRINDPREYKIVKQDKKLFIRPDYEFLKNLDFFLEIGSLRKTKLFPEEQSSEFLFSKENPELTGHKKNILDKFGVKKILVEDSIIFGPFIFAGMFAFIISNISLIL